MFRGGVIELTRRTVRFSFIRFAAPLYLTAVHLLASSKTLRRASGAEV